MRREKIIIALLVLVVACGLIAAAPQQTGGGQGAGGSGSPAFNQNAVFVIGNAGTTQTIVPANGAVQTMTLSAAALTVSFTQPSGFAAKVSLRITQAVGANDTVTWTAVKWPGGIPPVMTATASAVDWYSCVLDGTTTWCTAGQNFQ